MANPSPFRMPLISDANLKELRPFVDRLRMINSKMGKDKLGFSDMSSVFRQLPVSTNNVIYIGDIVLSNECGCKKNQ